MAANAFNFLCLLLSVPGLFIGLLGVGANPQSFSGTNVDNHSSIALLNHRVLPTYNYPHFDNSVSAAHVAILKLAFRKAFDMLSALKLDSSPDQHHNDKLQRSFARYFLPQDLPTVRAIFASMLGPAGTPGPGSPLISNIIIHDGHPTCGPYQATATWQPSMTSDGKLFGGSTLYICPLFYEFSDRDHFHCNVIRQWSYPNQWMLNQASILVHELMHFDPITVPPNRGHVPIRDYGPATYGPYKMSWYKFNPLPLPPLFGGNPDLLHHPTPGSSLYIADTFHWFVNDLYWSIICNHGFNDPPVEADTSLPRIPGYKTPPHMLQFGGIDAPGPAPPAHRN